MKKYLLALLVRFALLLGFTCFSLNNIQAQCSASIPSENRTVCIGTDVVIPVLLSGNAPFTFSYQINGVPQGFITTSDFNDVLVVSGLSGPSVIVLSAMQDATGCQGTVSGAVTVEIYPPIVLTAFQTPITCTTGHDGGLQITASGGAVPYTYAWSNGGTEPTITGLDEGTYIVTVTDANGCSAVSANLIAIQSPLYNFTSTAAACNTLPTGTINVTLGSSTQYCTWSNGATTEDIANLLPHTYSVTVTESLTGCTGTSSITVAVDGNGLQISSFTLTPPICTQANGTATPVLFHGTPPYTYAWSNGATTSTITNLEHGNYIVSVTDAIGCTAVKDFDLYGNNNLVINTVQQLLDCNDADGTIELSISAGTPPYQILWSNGSTQEDLVNIGAGTYTVTVSDAGGCTKVSMETLATFSLSIQKSIANCGLTLDLQVTGGTAPFSYLWSNNETTEDVAGLPTGTYTVTVTDALGCTNTKSITGIVSVSPAEISKNTGSCTGGLSARLTAYPVSTCTFIWSNGSTASFLPAVAPGTYSVTVTTNLTGCSASDTVVVSQQLTNSQLIFNATSTPVSCSVGNDGTIDLTVSGNSPPFTYLWSNSYTGEDPSNLIPGSYFVTVTDVNGCTGSLFQSVAAAPNMPIMTSVITNGSCIPNSGSINLTKIGLPIPLIYLWSNGATTEDIGNLATGVYTATVTDPSGCVFVTRPLTVLSLGPSVNVQVLSNECNNAILSAIVSGGLPPYQYAWTGPNGFTSTIQNLTVSASGTYNVVVVDATGCEVQATYEASINASGICGFIAGKAVNDESGDCVADTGEPGLGGWLVKAESGSNTFYGVTDAQGYYWIGVPTGTYTIAALPPNALWETCPSGSAVTVDTPADTIPGGDLPVKTTYQCPLLTVSIGTNVLRPCFSNNAYHVTYCNQGTMLAEDTYILMTLDPLITPLTSSLPYTNMGGGVLGFNIGDLAVGQCGYFSLKVLLSCDAVLGQTHCTEAHIYPEGNCIPPNIDWSGASLRLTSQCNPDSLRFTIKNVGVGDMQSTSDYIVVEDAVMLIQQPFQLGSGDSTMVVLPKNGSTWRIEVDQAPLHPGLSAPALSLEGCSTNPSFSTGYVIQFANNDADPWIDIDCTQNTGSYDPNDKQGFPVGYGTEHYIRPGTELEYLIRFQNTGTDTAFTVRVADTLSAWLDPATIRPGPGSHPYRFDLTGTGIAQFLFENILLPDSNVNQVGSNGFVKFSIYPKADAPLETLIENTAAIYFDFNEPVITNTTRHRLGENFLMVGLWQPQRPEYQVSVSPNPFSESARLEVKGLTSAQSLHLQVFDLQGKTVYEETASGPVFHLKKGSLKTGLYLFKLDQKGVMIGSGKLLVRD